VPTPPSDQTCDNSVLSGTYEFVVLGSVHKEASTDGQPFRETDRQSGRFTAEPQNGEINVTDVTGSVSSLEFSETSGDVTATIAEESSPGVVGSPFTVAGDCTFTSGEFTGAVSPDGDIVVATRSTVEALVDNPDFIFNDGSGAGLAVAIGLRQSP